MLSRTLLYVVFTVLIGCNTSVQPINGDVMATVGSHTLMLNDILISLGDKIRLSDSATAVNEYIEQWILEKALLEKAEVTLTAEERNKSALVSQYYTDLLIYELERKILTDRLDTLVDLSSITTYYENNKKNFELSENIVRLRFFSIPKEVVDHDKLWLSFKSGEAENMEMLSRICELGKSNYFNQDSVWLSFNDVLKEIPIITYNQESYLNNHRFIRLDELDFSHFVQILDFKVKNNISPFDFEKDRIKDIIIHKRKVELLKQIESEIVEEAYRNNKIEKF